MTVAQNALDEASARYTRLKQIVDTQDVNGSLTESLNNPNIAQLRARYLAAAKLDSEISANTAPITRQPRRPVVIWRSIRG